MWAIIQYSTETANPRGGHEIAFDHSTRAPRRRDRKDRSAFPALLTTARLSSRRRGEEAFSFSTIIPAASRSIFICFFSSSVKYIRHPPPPLHPSPLADPHNPLQPSSAPLGRKRGAVPDHPTLRCFYLQDFASHFSFAEETAHEIHHFGISVGNS